MEANMSESRPVTLVAALLGVLSGGAVSVAQTRVQPVVLVGPDHLGPDRRCAFAESLMTYFGRWDPSTHTCHLEADVTGGFAVVLTADGVGLDCAGNSIEGTGFAGTGVVVAGRSSFRVTRCAVSGY